MPAALTASPRSLDSSTPIVSLTSRATSRSSSLRPRNADRRPGRIRGRNGHAGRCRLQSVEQWRNPNCVKVVCDASGQALYFSRSPIPFVRDGQPDFAVRPAHSFSTWDIYAYRRRFLLTLADLPPHPLEQLEKLEQLRVLALGMRIQVGVVGCSDSRCGHFDDYLRFVAVWRQNRQGQAA